MNTDFFSKALENLRAAEALSDLVYSIRQQTVRIMRRFRLL